uniref:DNA-directed RNA polymerase n=1 Tax=Tarenaya spinosa TaxID=228870 RepID=Q1KUU5_9ROSI|nr:hypothetical protein [Tarenaya spinosa]
MTGVKPTVILASPTRFFDHLVPLDKPLISSRNPVVQSSAMWRNIAKQTISRSPVRLSVCRQSRGLLGFSSESIFPEIFIFRPSVIGPISSSGFHDMGYSRTCEIPAPGDFSGRPGFGFLKDECCFHRFSPRSYVNAAEAVSSTDIEEDASVVDEVQELLREMKKEEKKEKVHLRRVKRQEDLGMLEKKYQSLKRRQVKIETEAWEKAANEYKELLTDMCEQKLAPNLPYVKSLFLGWFEPLREAIAKDQELYRLGKNRANYAYYIDQLPADMIAVITMHKLMGLLMTGGDNGCVKVIMAACTVGDAIEQEIRICRFLEKTKKKKENISEGVENVEKETTVKEEDWLKRKVSELIKKQKLPAVRQILNSHDASKPWSTDVRAKVGSRLIELFMKTAYIQPPTNQRGDDPPDIRPAFVHTFKTVKNSKKSGRRYGVIECDPLVRKGLEKTGWHMVMPYMPMLVPPVNWSGYDRGAYFFLPSYLMRIHGAKQQREALKSTPRKQLQLVFEALDTLGNAKWRVNKRVLSIVDRIWNSGGRLADLVDRSDVPLPEKPDTEDENILKKWKWKVKSANKENRERHSQRCDIELKLNVARKMKDEEGFYYPHNIDFRGRAYPMHPHLNHLGSDLCRGVLEFAEGKPLGSSGLRWLKIHLANLYAGGVDKLSFEGRLAFTENHLDDIFNSADRPLEGRRWWLQAEDPFQCLAVCINITEALRSPCPETFVSHIPIHQLGAAAVNLVAGEKPADVYSGIAARVLDIMRRDAEQDPEVFPDALRARNLVNQVDRKLVKQTVMTSVYGVTYIGARDQIKRRLKERSIFTDDTELFGAACYAAKVTLTALGEMFQAARDIMSWLGECAKIIASQNQPVRWTTPLGLPVVQPYRKMGRHTVMVKRQRTAFPPNFVHSLDGSHMMMTAVACRKAGICFAGVHDSYWTHACDVDELNRTLREKFVELYDKPILEDLLESFEKSFPHLSFPPLPERGDFDLREGQWSDQNKNQEHDLVPRTASRMAASHMQCRPINLA